MTLGLLYCERQETLRRRKGARSARINVLPDTGFAVLRNAGNPSTQEGCPVCKGVLFSDSVGLAKCKPCSAAAGLQALNASMYRRRVGRLGDRMDTQHPGARNW